MQKFTKLFSLFFLLGILSSASCEKDPEPDQDPQKLIIGTWQRTNLEFANNGNWQEDSRTCYLDDTEEFTADGKWNFLGGTVNCGSGSGILSGTYRFEDNGTNLIFTYSHAAGEYKKAIISLDDQNMILTHEVGDVNNTQARTTYVRR